MTRRMTAVLGALGLLVAARSAYAIGFVDSPTASCRKIKGNECAISWYYVSVNGAPNYITTMRIQLQLTPGGPQDVVFSSQGFFQTSLYVPYDMIGEFKVPCGKAGTSPDPLPLPSPAAPVPYGNAYGWTIRARDSANLTSANYGIVYCPGK